MPEAVRRLARASRVTGASATTETAREPEASTIADLQRQLDAALRQLHIRKGRHDWAADYIAGLTSGLRTTYGADFDVLTASGDTLEVKRSDVLPSNRLVSKATRWVWDRLRGSSGTNRYDYLILLGEKDPRFKYPEGDYVFFCIPFIDVWRRLKKSGWLQCSTRFRGPWSRQMREWLVTQEYIIQKFGPKRKAKDRSSESGTAKVLRWSRKPHQKMRQSASGESVNIVARFTPKSEALTQGAAGKTVKVLLRRRKLDHDARLGASSENGER